MYQQLQKWGYKMKNISYWEQFVNSGKVEDYLIFKEATGNKEEQSGDYPYAGIYRVNGNDYKDSAYR